MSLGRPCLKLASAAALVVSFLLGPLPGPSRAHAQIDDLVARLVATGLATVGSAAAGRVEDAIRLRVQQTISSLPPTSAQPVSFRYDAEIQSWVRGDLVPPTAFLTPEILPRGDVSLRVSASYFELRELRKSANYTAFVDSLDIGDLGVFKFGVTAGARVEVIGFAAGYGLTDWLEIDLDVPVTIVNANAQFLFSATDAGDPLLGAFLPEDSPFSKFTFFPSARNLDDRLADGSARLVARPLSDLGVDGLDGSTEIGLGRTSVAAKAALLRREGGQLAFQLGVYMPSPSADELAGTDTTSLFPRFVGSLQALDSLRFYGDVGYDWDFDLAELRRFVWNVGGSWATSALSLDLGIGGSLYQQGIDLFLDGGGLDADLDVVFTNVDDDFELQTNLIDVVVGVKVRIASNAFVSGVATIPVVDVDFRPEAIGTISAQVTF